MSGDPKRTFSSLTDEAVLDDAFEQLRSRLLVTVVRRLGPGLAKRVDAEGVLHDAYLRALARWPGLSPKPADLTTWLYSLVRDKTIEAIRAALGPTQGADRDVPWPEDSMAEVASQLVDSRTGPLTAAARNERGERVHRALQHLKPIDREIVILHYFDGLNFAQIGSVLNLAQNTVNRKCARALLKLKDLLPGL